MSQSRPAGPRASFEPPAKTQVESSSLCFSVFGLFLLSGDSWLHKTRIREALPSHGASPISSPRLLHPFFMALQEVVFPPSAAALSGSTQTDRLLFFHRGFSVLYAWTRTRTRTRSRVGGQVGSFLVLGSSSCEQPRRLLTSILMKSPPASPRGAPSPAHEASLNLHEAASCAEKRLLTLCSSPRRFLFLRFFLSKTNIPPAHLNGISVETASAGGFWETRSIKGEEGTMG